MQFKQIGILIGGGGLLMFAALQDQSGIDSTHSDDDRIIVALSDAGTGFSVAPPQGFVTTEKADGVLFMEEGDLRAPMRVEIDVRPGEALADATEERAIKAGTARYVIEELDGGSGGSTWQLRAVRPAPNGSLMMTAVQQAEAGPPDFSRAWATFESIEITK